MENFLKNLVGKDEKFALGKAYDEALTVQNSGSIDTFVRVILTKSWTDADGNKNTRLSPDLIDLNLLTDNGWVMMKVQQQESVPYFIIPGFCRQEKALRQLVIH